MHEDSSTPSPWLTTGEAAEILDMHVETLYSKLCQGQFRKVSWHLVPRRQRTRGCRIYLERAEVEAAATRGWRCRIFRPDEKTPSAEESIYLAGLFDGEGCISIQERAGKYPTYTLTLSVVNTAPDVIAWLKQTFGGSTYTRPRTNPRWMPMHTWVVSSIDGYRTLQRIGPHLRIKHRQAEIAIEFFERMVAYDGGKHNRLTPEEREWRRQQRLLLRSYNGRRAVYNEPNSE